MEQKRKISIFIPYILEERNVLVFLQKRTKDAPRYPDCFGFFGGGIEADETPEEAVKRETKEELDFNLENPALFKRYEFTGSIKHIFILQVDSTFEQKVTVLEGQYGKWFSEAEALSEVLLKEEDKLVLRELYGFLPTNK